MLGPTTMAIGAGPLYTNAVMGQSPSAVERENARKASSTILRRNCIHIEESDNLSRPESWSMHFDCTNQAPYSTRESTEMITQTSLLHLPPENPSHDLAFFLRTTGPTAPHRRPSKLERPRRAPSGTKDPFRFLRIRQRRSRNAHEQPEIQDEGGLLAENEERPIAKRVKQKVSSEGTKYLALQVADSPSPIILDSDVFVCVLDDHEGESLDERPGSRRGKRHWRAPTPAAKVACNLPFDDEGKVGVDGRSSNLPVRPAASCPPTPENESGVSARSSNHSGSMVHPAKRSFETSGEILSHAPYARTSASLPLPNVLLASEQPTVEPLLTAKDVEIKHPSPRRLASHPLLSKRASSIVSSAVPRSVSDSPGPPPKSPLRLRREPRNIEGILAFDEERKATPRIAPSIIAVDDYNADNQIIKSTVVTDCTGPIKRQRSRGKGSRAQKEREERIRARKLRDRPSTTRTIDAVVNAPPPAPRQRLKKARPHIQIPDIRPPSFARRASSSASSNASWKKVTDFPYTITPATWCENALSNGDKPTCTPISPNASNESGTDNMALSSVMLIAEEIPLPKAKPTERMSKVGTKEGRSYAPRPRSASIPRSSTQRRSRQGFRTPTRPETPNKGMHNDNAPPLPSPPPTRALPPPPSAPPTQESSGETQVVPVDTKSEARISSLHDLPPNAVCSKLAGKVPHVATQTQRKRVLPKDSNTNPEIHARLEALEKNNALLSAALTAVLRTNGALNSPLPVDVVEIPRNPMVWENRIARRSAASNGGSSSNGSALEMYMNTRHGSRHGR